MHCSKHLSSSLPLYPYCCWKLHKIIIIITNSYSDLTPTMCQYCLRHFVSQIHTVNLQDKYYCLHITDEETSWGRGSHFLKTSHLLRGRDKTLTQSHLFIHPLSQAMCSCQHTLPSSNSVVFSVIFCVNKYKKIKEVGFCTFAILKIIDHKGKKDQTWSLR